MDQYTTLKLKEAERLLGICAGMGPQGAVFAGNLFEGLVIRYSSGEDPGQGTFRLFAEMKKVDKSSESSQFGTSTMDLGISSISGLPSLMAIVTLF